MAHVRRQVLDQIITNLSSATTVGTNVTSSRIYIEELPATGAIRVTYTSDVVDLDASVMAEPMLLTRELSVDVEIYLRDTADVEDALDDIAADAEAVLGVDCNLGGLCDIFHLSDTGLALSSDGDAPHGLLTMTYTARYRVAADDPQTQID